MCLKDAEAESHIEEEEEKVKIYKRLNEIESKLVTTLQWHMNSTVASLSEEVKSLKNSVEMLVKSSIVSSLQKRQ